LADFIKLFTNIFEFLLLVSERGNPLVLFDPFLPLLVLEFLHLEVRFIDVLGSLPHSLTFQLSIIPEGVVELNLLGGEILCSIFRKLTIPIPNYLLIYDNSISFSFDFSIEVDLFFVILRATDCKFDKLAFKFLLKVRLCSFPHFLGVNVANAYEFQL
jgi:hypothetical protein